MDNEGRIASALVAHAPADVAAGEGPSYEQTLRQLQAEVQSLRKQLRASQLQQTTLRGREVELRLTNEGLMDELSRWQRQTQQATAEAQEQQIQQARARPSSAASAPISLPSPASSAAATTSHPHHLLRVLPHDLHHLFRSWPQTFEAMGGAQQAELLEALQAIHNATHKKTELPA